MDLKQVETHTATIYVGFKNRDTGATLPLDIARQLCQQYCDEKSLCVSIMPLEYVYKNGNESGCAVGLINYPRFPMPASKLEEHAVALALNLKEAYSQYKVSVVCPTYTYMLSTEPVVQKEAA